MKPRRARVWFLASDDQGGGDHRSFWPAEALRRLGWDAEASLLPPEPGDADVLVIHRPLWGSVLDVIAEHQQAGTTVVVDEDDDLEHLPEHMRHMVPEDARIRHALAVERADAVFVSTAPLLELYRGAATFLCRNFVDPAMGSRTFSPRGPQPLRVGWSGIGKTHAHDLRWLKPFVNEAFGGATFLHVGDREAQTALAYSGPHEHHDFADHHSGAYFSVLARADVGIVPLDPAEPINLSKSSIKAQSFAVLGIPCVATCLPEQEHFVSDGSSGFLASSPREFASCVQTLLSDESLRAKMGAEAKARCFEHAASEPLQWERALREVLVMAGKGHLFEKKETPPMWGDSGAPISEHPTVKERPGTLSGAQIDGKPTAEEVPWRSKFYVTPRQSADGNAYDHGDPIPEAEARRQGVIPEDAVEARAVRHVCSRCKGSGKYQKKLPNHPDEHPGCKVCAAVCPRCDGTGSEPEAEVSEKAKV